MIENNFKRILLYELKIETFTNQETTGFGNFEGLINKLDYIKTCGFNVIAINDILTQYQNKFELQEIKNRYGSITDFVKCIDIYRKNQIEIAPIIDIFQIKQSYINLNNMLNLYDIQNSNDKKQLTSLDTYLVNDSFKKINLNTIANLITYFDEILSFYVKCNIKTIIISNFDFLIEKNNLIEKNKFQFLEDIYKIVKRQNVSITVILKSNQFHKNLYSEMLKNPLNCCDYLYLTHIAKNGIISDEKSAKKQKFNFKYFVKTYKPFFNNKRIILSFGSDDIGRINSRWGDELSYLFESAKAFILLLFAGKNSIGIYYGDELGILRAKIRRNYEFNNPNYNEEKRFYQANNINEDEYFAAQSFQNKWTSYTLMPWTKEPKNSKAGALNSLKIDKTNVESQLIAKDSPLNFLINLKELIFNTFNDINFGKSKIAIYNDKKGIIKISHKIKNNLDIDFLVNLTSKHLPLANISESKIAFTTYAGKFYASLPKELSPFEGIILLKEKKYNE
ncbi:alpha-amylase family glycosyl hydrolase [Metamycoplasma equirhinis]|uniref:alpha-amylase family glycosyl hydrolase n=1 Tax=Metamycoplasma equirhinis TaxID=92402 RepID=UPI003593AA1A